MMKRLGVLLILLGLLVPAAQGQTAAWRAQAQDLTPLSDLVSNQVQVLEPAGDSLWIGPLLSVYLEAEDALRIADVPALNEGDDVVFAIEAGGASVWAGLAFDTGGSVPGAGGFVVSTDGGETFDERPPQLDAPEDTVVSYGVSTLLAVPITQQAESAPQSLAFGPAGDTVWVAGLRSGLRWTVDDGETWNRVVLPPDTSQSVDPRTPTDFIVAPPLDDGRGFLNHVSFSVLVDETGTVWAGTANGVNRSSPASVAADGSRAWRRFATADTANSVPGDVVVDLAEQPRPNGRNAVWMAAWAGQSGGATATVPHADVSYVDTEPVIVVTLDTSKLSSLPAWMGELAVRVVDRPDAQIIPSSYGLTGEPPDAPEFDPRNGGGNGSVFEASLGSATTFMLVAGGFGAAYWWFGPDGSSS